jgi:hypothetical protein
MGELREPVTAPGGSAGNCVCSVRFVIERLVWSEATGEPGCVAMFDFGVWRPAEAVLGCRFEVVRLWLPACAARV